MCLYKIKDNYIRFWFSFIYPNMSFIESGNSPIVMDKIRQDFISRQVAFVYGEVCRERMWTLNASNCWPFHFSRIGRWWNGKNKIDIVAVDPEGRHLILGECKYWQKPVGLNILRELEAKADCVEGQKTNRHVWFVLFSAAGFSTELKDLATVRDNLLLFDGSDA